MTSNMSHRRLTFCILRWNQDLIGGIDKRRVPFKGADIEAQGCDKQVALIDEIRMSGKYVLGKWGCALRHKLLQRFCALGDSNDLVAVSLRNTEKWKTTWFLSFALKFHADDVAVFPLVEISSVDRIGISYKGPVTVD